MKSPAQSVAMALFYMVEYEFMSELNEADKSHF